MPENENIKIPVAIKVLKEGTGTNTNKEILEVCCLSSPLAEISF